MAKRVNTDKSTPTIKSGKSDKTGKAPSSQPAAKASPKRTRRSAEVIEKLLIQAAREEFKRSGFFGATTASIAAAAEVTEAQLFRYFPSKAELFRTAVFEPLNEHFSQFNARYPSAGEGEDEAASWERAHQYISELQAFLDEHSKLLLAVVVAQIFQTGQLHNMERVESLESYFQRGAELMSRRVSEGAGINPTLLVRVSFAALMGCVLFKEWFLPPGLASEAEVNEAITQFVATGVELHRPADGAAPSPAERRAGAAKKRKPKPEVSEWP